MGNFNHSWILITHSYELPTPYYKCAKCGLCTNKDPELKGCSWEN